MPLAHDCLSHGQVAFGFFNIDSDMLLLLSEGLSGSPSADRHGSGQHSPNQQLSFFADAFCAAVEQLATSDPPAPRAELPGYRFTDPDQIGDLMGAIHGVRFEGFIGEVYRRFPFPRSPSGFRQKPEGDQTQAEVRQIIERYAQPCALQLALVEEQLRIEGYFFSPEQAMELLRYVWRGGMPRWRDDRPPAYVARMWQVVEAYPLGSRH